MDHSVHSYGILFIATPFAKLQISCDKLVVSCGGNEYPAKTTTYLQKMGQAFRDRKCHERQYMYCQ